MADNNNLKHIGEAKLTEAPKQKLTLKLKDGSVTTKKIADGAVFTRKLVSDDCQQDFSKVFSPQKTGQPLVDAAEEYMAEVRRRVERRQQYRYRGLDLLLGLTGRTNDREENVPCLDMSRPLTYGNRAARGGNLHSSGKKPMGLMQMARMQDNAFNTNIGAYGGNLYSGENESTGYMRRMQNSSTGEIGKVIDINPEGTYNVEYSNGIIPMALQIPNVTILGKYNPRRMSPEEKEGLMRIHRNLDAPMVGGELKNNQYRTMPTNEEASRFADQYVAATEFKPWHLVTAPAKGLDILAPSRWVGLMDDANDMGFSYLYDDRNPGFFIGNDPTKPFSKEFAQEHPYWAMAGNMVGDVAAGYGISKTLGAVGDVYNAGKAAIATSTNPNMQYVRYGLGKINGWVHGYNPKLPTLYRKVKGMPTLENGKVIISTPYNRFAYESGFGQESPLITNFSSDVPVRRHPDGNWNWAPTLAMPGESLLGKNVISTRPSDIFTFGDNISVPVKKVTAITGRQKELDYFKDLGIKTLTSPESQSSFGEDLATYMADVRKARARNARILERKKMGHMTPKRKWPEKDFNNYASEIQKVTRTNFRNPTIKDYEFMDYVFNPQYTSEVVPNMDITEAVTLYPSLVGSWFGNSGRRMYIANPDEWVNVMYDPYSPAEALFRKSKGIDLKPKWQNK